MCKKTNRTKIKNVSMYRFPKDLEKRRQWLTALNLTEESLKEHHRVCSRHFPNGDATHTPSLHIGERFASPKKMGVRASLSTKRRKLMNVNRETKHPLSSPSVSPSPTPSTVAPGPSCATNDPYLDALPLRTPVGEPLLSDYSMHELPSESGDPFLSTSEGAPPSSDISVTVNAALIAQIEALEVDTINI